MRQSRILGATLKQEPKDTSSQAHRFLLRGGFVKPAGSGLYAVMPLLKKVLDRLSGTVQARLEEHGFAACLLPVLQSRSNQEQSGPWSPQPGQALAIGHQRGAGLGLGPGIEALFAGLVKSEVSAAKHLPKRIQAITPLFWDDLRSRQGLVRMRESLSLQAMGCDADQAGAEDTARRFQDTALDLCSALELEAGWVSAASSPRTGASDQALAIWTGQGSDTVLTCPLCHSAATMDRAWSRLEHFAHDEPVRALEAVHGPGLIGVEPLARFLDLPVWRTTKTLLMKADDRMVAVMVRGDCDVSEAKVRRHLQCAELRLASAQEIQDLTGAEVGYAGPIDLPQGVLVLADEATRDRVNFECGANRTDYHLINVNFERDLDWPVFGDFKQAAPGHFCPHCSQGRLEGRQAEIVGWSTILDAAFARQGKCLVQLPQGGSAPMAFTSCGLDLGAMAVALVEHHHDASGVVWPLEISPFQVHLVGLNLEKEDISSRAERLYRDLRQSGLSVLFDDRPVRAGEKFGDADLLGLPVRVTLSARTWADSEVELKLRNRDDPQRVPLDRAVPTLTALV